MRGQPDLVTLPDGRTSDSDYAATGEVSLVTGTAAPAVARTYDYAGRVLTLTTQPGTGAAAVTAWTYHTASGRPASKTHAANSGTEYFTWTAGGRALTRPTPAAPSPATSTAAPPPASLPVPAISRTSPTPMPPPRLLMLTTALAAWPPPPAVALPAPST